MRCPHCKRKVHPDDIYCVYCSASLRGKSPADPWNCVCGDEDAHRAHKSTHPRRNSGRRSPAKRGIAVILLVIALAVLPTLLTGAVFFVDAMVDEIHTLTVVPEPMAHPPIATEPIELEAPVELGGLMAHWEDFDVTADYVSMDPVTGELVLCYTARNGTDVPILSAEALVTVEDFGVSTLHYFEVQPGETLTDYLWIDTDALQAVGITRVEELTISLHLEQTGDYADLGWTEPLPLEMDFDLPALEIQLIKQPLYQKEGVSVFLMGLAAQPEYGELTLYTMVENNSAGDVTVRLENAWSGVEELYLFGFYNVQPGHRMVSKELLYDLPFRPGALTPVALDHAVEVRFDTHRLSGIGTTALELTEDGILENIDVSTGHEVLY